MTDQRAARVRAMGPGTEDPDRAFGAPLDVAHDRGGLPRGLPQGRHDRAGGEGARGDPGLAPWLALWPGVLPEARRRRHDRI